MWQWATSSEGAARPWALPVLLAVCLAVPAPARVFLTVDEALELAFPGCTVERQTVYLSAEQRARVEALAGGRLPSAIVYPYRAACPEGPGGTAYFDAHRVRTLPETLMIVVGPDGRLRRLEVLAFREPPDYLPRAAWYEQFDGRTLDDELALKRGIRPVTGATLTARATTAAVRRTLALDRVLRETAEATPSGSSGEVP